MSPRPAGGPRGAAADGSRRTSERRAQVGEGGAAGVLDVAQRPVGLAGVALEQVRRDARLDVDRGHRVGHDVVDLAGDAQPLLAHAPQRLLLGGLHQPLLGHAARPDHLAGGDRQQDESGVADHDRGDVGEAAGEWDHADDHAGHDGQAHPQRATAVAVERELEQGDHRDDDDRVGRMQLPQRQRHPADDERREHREADVPAQRQRRAGDEHAEDVDHADRLALRRERRVDDQHDGDQQHGQPVEHDR